MLNTSVQARYSLQTALSSPSSSLQTATVTLNTELNASSQSTIITTLNQGIRGLPGAASNVPGPPSTEPGPQGASAYQVALAAEYVGSEIQWLASLQGRDGKDGNDASVTAASIETALGYVPASTTDVQSQRGLIDTVTATANAAATAAGNASTAASAAQAVASAATTNAAAAYALALSASGNADASYTYAESANTAAAAATTAAATADAKAVAVEAAAASATRAAASADTKATAAQGDATSALANAAAALTAANEADDTADAAQATANAASASAANAATAASNAATAASTASAVAATALTATNAAAAKALANTFQQVNTFEKAILLNSELTPATPPANFVAMFGRNVGGRILPAFMGPSGLDSILQASLARNAVAFNRPQGNGLVVGSVSLTFTTTGTATTANVALTSLQNAMKRIEYAVTTAVATAVCGWRGAATQYGRGVAPYGGFHFVTRFGIPPRGNGVASRRLFVGFRSSTAAPTDVEPSTLTNAIGVGFDAADTKMHIFYNDASGACSKIDLGSDFAKPSAGNEVFEFAMFCQPGGSEIGWAVYDWLNNKVAAGSLNTNIPAETIMLNPYVYYSVGGTSSVIGLLHMGTYVETDF